MKLPFVVALLVAPSVAIAGGFGHWAFGMTAAQIRAVTDHGPYDAFTNGDLETYNATLCDQKQNVQFYLKDGVLWRIVVVTYEGTSSEDAARRWAWTYECLYKLYGTLETPDLKGTNLQELAAQAQLAVAAGAKVQMAPQSQPKGNFVFSSFNTYEVKGVTTYRVWVNYDRPSS
ncbi:hypothetical protein ACFCQI_04650 [Rhodanobacter sp. FW102-FHT14D06]|uniref:Uncharacterized protein n=2 Tax=unclassified Rhodanobacter TaxID=2621553 RepID=A0AB74UV34_9GAMM